MSFFRRAGAAIVRFFTSAADPAAAAGELQLYSKVDGGGDTQLYARSDDGTIYQLTPVFGLAGTPDTVAKFTGAGTTIGDSLITDDGTVVDVNSDLSKFGVSDGSVYLQSTFGVYRIGFAFFSAIEETGYINFGGFNGDTAVFRNLIIGNGTGLPIATLTGSTRRTELHGGVTLSGIISPAALGAADNPDYAPAGFDGARIIRLTSGGALSTISGLAGGSNGRIITLVNISGSIVTILAASGLSAAANQFASGTVLAATSGATSAQSYFYDGASSLWRTI